MAASEAGVAQINLEDLWLETRPQNTPGTYLERPNWRRKAARTLEEIQSDPHIRALLERIDKQRRKT